MHAKIGLPNECMQKCTRRGLVVVDDDDDDDVVEEKRGL
jgi:hypothetical protein